jgi:hypothetical protein
MAVSLRTVAEGISKYKLDLVGLEMVGCDRSDNQNFRPTFCKHFSTLNVKHTEPSILSRVYGSVTNKNGFLDWMIGFINTFYNLSQSQSITITQQ